MNGSLTAAHRVLEVHSSRIADFLQRNSIFCLIAFSVLYLILTCADASQKAFWIDELNTLYFARLSFSDLWDALSAGADQNPPLFVTLTRASAWLLGENQISLRLPAILAFLLMMLCLFRFVTSRSNVLYGFVAMLFPLVTRAYYYAYEARAYALLLGFGALSLYTWASAARARRSFPWGLALATLATSASHYYGIFLLFPLSLGELARSIARRKIDFPIWITFLFAFLPLFVFLPLIKAGMLYAGTYWGKPHWSGMITFYDFLLRTSLPAVLAMLAVFAFFPMEAKKENTRATFLLPSHEVVALVGFVFLPILTIVIAKIITGAYSERYALPSIIGISLLMTSIVYRLANGRTSAVIAIILVLFLGYMGRGVREFYIWKNDSRKLKQSIDFVRRNATADLPVVIWAGNEFYRFYYYGGDVSQRITYLADPGLALQHLGHDTLERGLVAHSRWFPARAQNYRDFVSSHDQFLLYGLYWNEDWNWNWLLSQLLTDGVDIQLKSRDGNNVLFLVTNSSVSGTQQMSPAK